MTNKSNAQEPSVAEQEKDRILNCYIKLREGRNAPLTRDGFNSDSDVSKHQVNKYFGSFSALKDIGESYFEKTEGDQSEFEWVDATPKTAVDVVEWSSIPTVSLEEEEFQKVGDPSFTFEGMDGEASSCGENVKTLDDLIRVCNIDLKTWYVERYLVNKWPLARKKTIENLKWENGKQSGHTQDMGELTQTHLYQVKAWLKRISKVSFQDMVDDFRKEISQYSPSTFSIPKKLVESGNLYFMGIPDHHHGKLAWGKETGYDDYNSEISKNLYREAVSELLSRVVGIPIEKVLYVIGHDFFNVDNKQLQTTAGTPQSQEMSWKKMFREGIDMAIESIYQISSLYPVDVQVVVGNHDWHSTFALGENVASYFRNNANVKVINNPQQRHYYRWGNNLLGMTHGNEPRRLDALPLLMANESPDWSDTKYRHWFIGHYHHQSLKEYNGVKVEILPALCGTDEWHSSNGYTGNVRSSKAFLLNKDKGQVANYYFNL